MKNILKFLSDKKRVDNGPITHTIYDDKPWTRSTHGYIPYGHYTISRNGGLSHYETEAYLASSMFVTSNAPLMNQSFGDEF